MTYKPSSQWPLEPKTEAPPNQCPLPGYACACRGDWCRLRGRNLSDVSGGPKIDLGRYAGTYGGYIKEKQA
jgi:hypothetical protein